jgi:thiamine kinase-like enzyme
MDRLVSRVPGTMASTPADDSVSPDHSCLPSCPQHIVAYIEEHFGPITGITEAQSAQQRVLLLSVTARDGPYSDESEDAQLSHSPHPPRMVDTKLVVRIWKGGSRWWNLHQPTAAAVQALARSEIAGYRVARHCLRRSVPDPDTITTTTTTTTHHQRNCHELNTPTTTVDCHGGDPSPTHRPALRIPRVRYECLPEPQRDAAGNAAPWAVLEYIGADGDLSTDDSWITGMIRTRTEFGLDEPHPRWGRVPTERALEYTLLVLRSVILPLHRSMNATPNHDDIPGIDGLHGYRNCCSGDRTEANNPRGIGFSDMLQLYERTVHKLNALVTTPATRDDRKLAKGVELLAFAVTKLQKDASFLAESSILSLLPPVLCHMDCQPQNLMFVKCATTSLSPTASPTPDDPVLRVEVSSVLDWEEAAYADPRFELLLLCRKVCANRSQADRVWETYRRELPQPHLGPIDPWLRLETVHSLTTLLLQAMKVGGRSPWESQPDLWGKIQREFQRLPDSWDIHLDSSL